MNQPLRIFLRFLALALFLGSVGAVIAIIAVGPEDVAVGMGKECAHNDMDADYCSWRDVLGLLEAFPYTALVAAVALVLLSPRAAGPDEPEHEPSPLMNRIGVVGAATLVLTVVAMFPTVYVYKAGYTMKWSADQVGEIKRQWENRETGEPSKAKPASTPATTPRGLQRGSLLRADAFRAAVKDLRAAAPAGARITNLRVAPERIDATVRSGGRLVRLSRPWNGRASVGTTTPATEGDTPIITFAQLDPAAPQRLARGAGKPVDYLVLQDVVGLRWNAFLAGGKGMVSAAPDGRMA